MEADRNRWNILETTVSYKAWARLTPTLIHVVTYKLVTSGAEDDAMSSLSVYECRPTTGETETRGVHVGTSGTTSVESLQGSEAMLGTGPLEAATTLASLCLGKL